MQRTLLRLAQEPQPTFTPPACVDLNRNYDFAFDLAKYYM